MPSVAALAAQAERRNDPPAGEGERFAGYGVMGVPFASGHVLAMRRFPASSVGPAYSSVWHRDANGRWEFWQDQVDEFACPRYFSRALAASRRCAIGLDWPAEATMRLEVPDVDLEWTISMAASPGTRALSVVGSLLPDRAWRAGWVLAAMGLVAGAALRAGKVRLVGTAPNGQRFMANPLRVWLVANSTARLRGQDLGRPARLAEQAHVGELWIPQRGVFVMGRALFTAGSDE